jgi:hypothetical protein
MVHQIGVNAGKIWATLNKSGAMDELSIQKAAGLTKGEVHKALGWLAREGKVKIESGKYKLVEGGDPKATEKYGKAAGVVWQVLFGENPSDALRDCLRLEEEVLHGALGWLAKEGKVDEIDVFIMESLHGPEVPSAKAAMPPHGVPVPPKPTKEALDAVMKIIESVPYKSSEGKRPSKAKKVVLKKKKK